MIILTSSARAKNFLKKIWFNYSNAKKLVGVALKKETCFIEGLLAENGDGVRPHIPNSIFSIFDILRFFSLKILIYCS